MEKLQEEYNNQMATLAEKAENIEQLNEQVKV